MEDVVLSCHTRPLAEKIIFSTQAEMDFLLPQGAHRAPAEPFIDRMTNESW